MMQIEREAKYGAFKWTAEVERLNAEVEHQLEVDWAQQTKKGWMVSPDRARGDWGPLYFSVLTKKEMK